MDVDTIKVISEYWNAGLGVEAGRVVLEHLEKDAQPEWAARILKLILDRSGVHSPSIQELLVIADQKELWRNGHQAFSNIRHEALRLDSIERTRHLTEDEKMRSWLLGLAELVAKVTYNATNPDDEFDEDSGWWIADSLRGYIDHKWNDEEFKMAAWSALCCLE